MVMSKFQMIRLFYVSPESLTIAECGFARNCEEMIMAVFPGLPEGALDKPHIQEMMYDVDNTTGELYMMEPKEGDPVFANSTLEGVLREYTDWSDGPGDPSGTSKLK